MSDVGHTENMSNQAHPSLTHCLAESSRMCPPEDFFISHMIFIRDYGGFSQDIFGGIHLIVFAILVVGFHIILVYMTVGTTMEWYSFSLVHILSIWIT